MREIYSNEITDAISALCTRLCIKLPQSTVGMLQNALEAEESDYGKYNLEIALKNAVAAAQNNMPVCQDTGMVTVFACIGQDVHINGDFYDAVNEGVRRAYVPFRKSVLSPLGRINTKDNTPAVIHVSLCEGDKIRFTVAPKGFGSENMSRLQMLKPSQGTEGVKKFILDTVSLAGANPCPPVIVGVGIGGTMEKAALMAKHAIAVSESSKDKELAAFEKEMLEKINKLGIGPQGMGGKVTALAVYAESYPTHIAGLPVAVNIQCHCARHGEVII